MLKPVTAKMTDESEGNIYRFTFYCDLCGAPRQSVPYESMVTEDSGACIDADSSPGAGVQIVTGNITGANRTAVSTETCERITDHNAAYERANFEALHYFNRCPVCKRMVCDTCYRILDDSDMCKECAETR